MSEQQAFGASVIKVALNADAGPVFDRGTLDAIVAAAHERGLPVVAHVEGDGMTRLAVEAGVDALAHTPFTERVDDVLVARAVAMRAALDLHALRDRVRHHDARLRARARQPAAVPRRRRHACSTAPTSATATSRSA